MAAMVMSPVRSTIWHFSHFHVFLFWNSHQYIDNMVRAGDGVHFTRRQIIFVWLKVLLFHWKMYLSNYTSMGYIWCAPKYQLPIYLQEHLQYYCIITHSSHSSPQVHQYKSTYLVGNTLTPTPTWALSTSQHMALNQHPPDVHRYQTNIVGI